MKTLLIQTRTTADLDAVLVATMTAGELRKYLECIEDEMPVVIRAGELQYGAIISPNIDMRNIGNKIKIQR